MTTSRSARRRAEARTKQGNHVRIEARVGGRAGPIVASAVSASHVRYVTPVTHLTIRSDEPIPLAVLLRRLEDLGLEVEQLRGEWRSSDDRDGTDAPSVSSQALL